MSLTRRDRAGITILILANAAAAVWYALHRNMSILAGLVVLLAIAVLLFTWRAKPAGSDVP